VLFSALHHVQTEIDEILRRSLGKRLFTVKRDDQLRLIKLKMWSTRHSVPLEYIIEKLVPHFEKLAQRNYVKKYAGASKGLGVPISVLTGPAAEEKLIEFIAKEFTEDEHIHATREAAKAECLDKLGLSENTGRVRPVLNFPSVDEYMKSYTSGIERKRRSGARIERKLAKQPYRGNPWL
jgi:hypothetical protein